MGDFDRRQLEQLNAIGEYLQQIRQDQGRSLDDISAKTYIPLRILRALEGGQEAILPEPVFVQGFIRRYGDALGLDGTSLSRNFPVERETGGYEIPEAEGKEATQTLLETRIQETPRSDHARAGMPSRRRRRTPLPGIIAGVLILGGLAFVLSRWLFASQRPQQAITAAPNVPAAPIAPAVPAAPASPSPDAARPAASPAATPSPVSTTNAPISVAMNVTADSWVEVTADGKVTYEGVLKKGTQRNWSAQKELSIVSGNAGGVSLSYNQGAARPMGSPGTVEEVTFTANSSSSASGNSAAPN